MNTKNKTLFEMLHTELDKDDLDREAIQHLVSEIERQARLYDQAKKKQNQAFIGKFKSIGDLAVTFYNAETDAQMVDFIKKIEDDPSDLVKALWRMDGYDYDVDGEDYTDKIQQLKDSQKIFREMLDRVLAGDILDEKQIKYIGYILTPLIQYVSSSDGLILQELPFDTQNYVATLYKFVIQVANKNTILPKRCEVPGCNKLFIPTPRGRDQRYCGDACRMRDYRRRKKIEISV